MKHDRLGPELPRETQEKIQKYVELQQAGLICLDDQFFPSVHYPPITMYSAITENALFETYLPPAGRLFDVYVHIPFCLRHCIFCHYPIRIDASDLDKDYYLKKISEEINLYTTRLGVKNIRARSVLIGGGTPTLLTPAQLKKFLEGLSLKIDMSSCDQFCCDVDPTTLLGPDGQERMEIMRSFGVNRLTLGAQSFDDIILNRMNRPHTAQEALKAVENIKRFGFKLNLEFIFGYPGQSLESWISTISQAIALTPEEIQLYQLKIIPYGDFSGRIKVSFEKKADDFCPMALTLAMKQTAISMLAQNGYQENIGRVFTKKPEDFSHYADNQCCGLLDQVGFGLTAFSSLRDRFALNTLDFNEYYSFIDAGKLPINRGLVRTKDDQQRWSLILPLKNRKVYKKYYRDLNGISLNEVFAEKIARLKEYGLLYEDEKILSLTPLGRFFANEVCHQFHHPRYMPFPEAAYAAGPLNPYND